MKRLAVITLVVAVAAGIAARARMAELRPYEESAVQAALQARETLTANPVPVALALGTFLLTVVYHKAKGKSLRESVEVAATRVTVVSVPPATVAAEAEPAVIKRAKARATWAQLLSDQIALQNRQRKLPEAVRRAEQEACYTEQAVADAEKALAAKRAAHDQTVAALEKLRKEKAGAETELGEIADELQKLAPVV